MSDMQRSSEFRPRSVRRPRVGSLVRGGSGSLQMAPGQVEFKQCAALWFRSFVILPLHSDDLSLTGWCGSRWGFRTGGGDCSRRTWHPQQPWIHHHPSCHWEHGDWRGTNCLPFSFQCCCQTTSWPHTPLSLIKFSWFSGRANGPVEKCWGNIKERYTLVNLVGIVKLVNIQQICQLQIKRLVWPLMWTMSMRRLDFLCSFAIYWLDCRLSGFELFNHNRL